MNFSTKKLIVLFLVIYTLLSPFSVVAYAEVLTDIDVEIIPPTFEGKTISILGDSICTYENVSSGIAAETTNTTIRDNRAYYKDGKNEVSLIDTWWIQAAEKIGASILVNNSYSNTTIFSPFSDGEELGYLTRPYNLHDNTGHNSGEEPDIIAVYMGTNDFSYHKSRLGSFENIDFSTLITESNDKIIYKKPSTSAEAYAIMLHKIKSTYPEAEIYCFTLLQRSTSSASDTALLRNFNKSILKIAQYMDCFVVDLYNESGITDDEKTLNRFLLDAYLHPNKKGMDAIESVFLASLYKNSKYSPTSERFNIEYNLSDVIINEGLPATAPANSEFKKTITNTKYGELDVSVLMSDENITDIAFSGNEIFIPAVTGDIEINISVKKDNRIFKSYRYENSNSNINNITTNENYQNTVTKQDNGTFKTEQSIILCYDTEWSFVFATSQGKNGTLVPFDSDEENSIRFVLDSDDGILGLSNTNNTDTIYGIDLKAKGIDTLLPHTYKITNTHNIDGTNIFTVFVDSKEIGIIDTCFVNGKATSGNLSDVYEKDIILNTINNAEFSLIDYIQVWERNTPANHKHTYKYPEETRPSCTEFGSTITTCDCGAKHSIPNINPLGHTEGNWIITKQTSAVEPGEAYKKCTVCGVVTQTKSIAQLKCDKPEIKELVNTPEGVKVTWNSVNGADSYRVYRHLKNGSWVYLCTTTSCSYIDTATQNGYWYYYTVRAVNEAGYSDYYTNVKSIQFLLSPTFNKSQNTQNGIYLSWNKITGAQGYYLYKKTGSGNWVYYCRVNSTSFTDKNVKGGMVYSYRIKAIRNKTVSGYYTNGITITRLTSPSIKTPLNTDSGIKLQWNKMTGAAGYFVYKKVGGYWRYIGKTTATAFTDTTAAAGSTYVYTVKAYDSFGNHSTYNTKGITSKRLTTPQITSAKSVNNGIQISWNTVSGASGYYIYKRVGNSSWKYVGKTAEKAFIDKTAVKGTTYTYTVKAYNGSYVSTYNASGASVKR